jgi:hypothetical protein
MSIEICVFATVNQIYLSRRSAVWLFPPQYRPHDASVLVRDSDDCLVEATSFSKIVDPSALRIGLSGSSSHHSTSSVHDERAKLLVAAFTDAK